MVLVAYRSALQAGQFSAHLYLTPLLQSHAAVIHAEYCSALSCWNNQGLS